MRSRPTTPCTPLSPTGENPLVRRARQLQVPSLESPLTPGDERSRRKPPSSPNFQRLISRNTSRVIKCVVVLSISLNLVSIPSLVGVISGPLTHWACPLEPAYKDAVCLPCGRTGIPGVKTVRTGNGYCCTKSADPEFKALVDRKLIYTEILATGMISVSSETDCFGSRDSAEKSHAPPGRTIINRMKTKQALTVARLMLNVEETKQKNKLIWMAQSPTGLAYIQGRIQLTGDALRVTNGGFYRIRSHFSFDGIQNKFRSTQDRVHIITHSVTKQSTNAQMLMVDKVMVTYGQYVSSDLVLTVKLRANDSVFVNVDTCRFLYNLPIANTFEIEKLW